MFGVKTPLAPGCAAGCGLFSPVFRMTPSLFSEKRSDNISLSVLDKPLVFALTAT
jgi:hypothetical protein